MARRVTIATVSMATEKRSRVEDEKTCLDYITETMEKVAEVNPDVVCLPEAIPCLWKVGEGGDAGRDLMVKLAAKHRTYLVGSVHERRGERLFNTGLVVDPRGEIVARYDKIHPPESELKGKITPGPYNQDPIETSFGKIGVQICFDANWHDGWKSLAAAGAEIIFFPSAFPGGRILESLALLNNVFVVPAIWGLHSGVIDNTGRWVAKTDGEHWWTSTTVDLERTVFHTDYHGQKIEDIRKKYGERLKVEVMEPEAWFVLEPVDESVRIADVIREFDLITFRDYLRRSEAEQDAARGDR
jgi:predicted amidohydrolase